MIAAIVEDDDHIAADILQILTQIGWDCRRASTAKGAHSLCLDPEINLILMDRLLPDGDGLDLVETLRSEGVTASIMMLTALGQTENRIDGFRRGADDYLPKPFDSSELIARVAALVRRAEGQVRTDLHIFEDIELHEKSRRAHRAGQHLALSPKEFDLLSFFVAHADDIVTRDMLLQHVWNLSFDPGTNVVDVNVGRLRRKLEIDGAPAILHTVRGQGFRLGLE